LAAGVVDQVVIAVANAANPLLAVALFSKSRAGVMLLAIAIGYAVIGLNRAFVGEVLLALTARTEGQRRDRLVADGLTTALAFAITAAVILTVAWAADPPGGRIDLRDLIWVALVVPFLLLHDTARYTYLAQGAQSRALLIDLVFVAAQACAVIGIVLAGRMSPVALIGSWGLGAAAGFALFALRTGSRPWRGDPRRWITQTRFLAGWFTATAVIGQFQVLAVNFLIVGRLDKSALAEFRLAQTALLQPVQNFNQALTSLLVPRLSRLAGLAAQGDPDEAASRAAKSSEPAAGVASALHRQVRIAGLALAGLSVVMVAIGVPVAGYILSRIPHFGDTRVLALPILIQAGIYLVQVPFTAALRGMHQGRLQFIQYAIFTTASLTSLVLGAQRWGLVGAAGGLTAGAAIGFVATIVCYAVALRRLRRGRTEHWTTDQELTPA
jgi:O-antigen/teichoic acid export membrane protein